MPFYAPSASPSSWRRDLCLLGLALALWFGLFLGSRPLNNPDEGRYTEIPREMAATGDYVTPRLNGVKYFEKPPLAYWLSAVTFEVAGVNEWSARLWVAVFAAAGGLMTYAAGRALHGRSTGLWAALVLATALLYYGLSRVILLDLIVAVTMAGALFAFLLGVRTPAGPRRRWLFYTFYACMALAVLTKGLIGFVLPCAAAFLWLLIFNQWSSLRPCYPVSGALLLLAIAAPWHVLAALRNPSVDGTVWPGYARGLALHQADQDPGWLWFYFVREHYLRFTTREHGRFEPWWFFIPVLVAGLLPWSVFGFQAVRRQLVGGWKNRQADITTWFLVTWIVVITAFFSKSQSKLAPYILPVFPAAAVLIGRFLAESFAANTARALRPGLWVFAALLVILAGGAAFAPLPSKFASLHDGLFLWRAFLVLALLGGAAAGGLALRRGRERLALIALTAALATLMASANMIAGRFDRRTTRDVALALKPLLRPGDEVFSVNTYAQDFPVYIGRTVDVVHYRGEMEYGIIAEPALTADRYIDTARFRERWLAAPRAYALIRKSSRTDVFGDGTLPATTVSESDFFRVVTNQPAPPSS